MPKVLKRRLRIIAPSYENGASGLYRICAPLVEMRRAGIVEAVLRDELKPSDYVDAFNWADLIWLQREVHDEFVPILSRARASGKTVAMDLDDFFTTRSVEQIQSTDVREYWRLKYANLRAIMRETDGMTVTTKGLQEACAEITHKPVFVVPNCIDHNNPRWHLTKPAHEGIIVGWMGGGVHEQDVELIKEPIKRILKELPYVTFKIVGYVPQWARELPPDRTIIDAGYTGLAEYPSHFVDFDIGLAPLQSTDFNRKGKSQLKILEMGIFGIPTVATNITPYRGFVHHKVNGLLVNDAEGWYIWIKRLCEDTKLREKLSQSIKDYVINYNTIAGNLDRWAEALYNIAKGGSYDHSSSN